MSAKYITHFLKRDEDIPSYETISAVFLVAFQNDKLLSIQNERGWDIPGGHIEGHEELLDGLRREVLEEAGAHVGDAIPYAVLSSSTSQKVMLFFASKSIELVEFVPSEDCLDRAILDPEELLKRYYGDKDLLRSLIEGGLKRLDAKPL